ncbi:MAG TPA: LysR family transcriptional regulator [Acetobacteraceae bacterium]|nr:LysR family transcriptional regulator [Acetobacteraceae bacterium]
MEMQQIRYFLALSQTLNFTRAAEECNVSQPALTRAVQALEAELDGELIRRERAQSHLTELGRRMLPLMQQCYDAALSARNLAKAVKSSDIAPLPLGVSNSVSMAVFGQPLAELFRAYPGAQLRIRRGAPAEVVDLLRQGDVELAIAGPLEPAWERLDKWPIFEEALEFVAHRDHRLGRVNDLGLPQLAGENFLIRAGDEMGGAVAEMLQEQGIAAVNSHEIDTDDELMMLLDANTGIAVLPESGLRSPTLQRLRIPQWHLTRTVFVYAVSGRRRSTVSTMLLNLLRAADLLG